MKVLLTGGSSLLGRALSETKPAGMEILSTWYTNHAGATYQMNVTDKSQVTYIFDLVQPEAVIHCAANGSVDFAENNYREAYLVNCAGTENLLDAAKDHRAKFVYISTNAVFDGFGPPYSEESRRQPLNAYGSIKRQAEEKVMDYRFEWQIIRPFLLYGWPWPGGRQNWATIIINKLSKSEKLKLVNDVIWQPTYAPDCARAIWQLATGQGINSVYGNYQNKLAGIYHVAGDERATLYDFGLKVCKVFGLNKKLLEPVGSDYFAKMAPRPKDTTFDLGKIRGLGIKLDGIEAGLRRMKRAAAGEFSLQMPGPVDPRRLQKAEQLIRKGIDRG